MRGWSAPKTLGRGLRPLATFAPSSLRSLHHPPEGRYALPPELALRRSGSLFRTATKDSFATSMPGNFIPVGNVFMLSSRPLAGAQRGWGCFSRFFFQRKTNQRRAKFFRRKNAAGQAGALQGVPLTLTPQANVNDAGQPSESAAGVSLTLAPSTVQTTRQILDLDETSVSFFTPKPLKRAQEAFFLRKGCE
jgi:hypothetical protein